MADESEAPCEGFRRWEAEDAIGLTWTFIVVNVLSTGFRDCQRDTYQVCKS